ncbi:MAG: MFS transporter [Eubacteriales bacterium]
MDLKLLRQKDFSLLIVGKLVSLLGSNMLQFALSLYVLAMTGSAAIFASMLSISMLPRLLFSPVAGVFGDWFDRKTTIVLLDFVNALVIAAFAVVFIFKGSLTIALIYMLVIILEITEIFFGSAMSAVLPSLVKKEELMAANSLNSLVMNIGNTLAPIIAAFLYSYWGMKLILSVCAVSFALSAVSEIWINIPKSHKQPEKISFKAFRTDLFEGVKIIKRNKLISTMIGLGTLINFSVAPLFTIGLIYIIKEVLLVEDIWFGAYQVVLSVSMIVAPLLCGRIIKKVKVGILTYGSFVIVAALMLLMSIFTLKYIMFDLGTNMVSFMGLLVLSFCVGLVVTVTNIALNTLFSQVVPLEAMGRTSTVYNLAVTVFIPLGQMIFGLLLDAIAPSLVVVLCAVVLIAVISVYKKALIGYDLTEQTEPAAQGELQHEI